MKQVRQLLSAVILLCALGLSTYAGDVSCPGIQPGPPATTAGHMDTLLTSDGEIPSGGMATGDIPFGMTAIVMGLIQSVL
jgi:hypothetical protein